MKLHYPVVKILAASVLTFGLAACSSMEPPTQKATLADSRIQQAIRDDADDAAPVYMKNARNRLKDAREAMEREDYRRADRLLDEALIATEYAMLKADTEKLEKAAEEIQQNIDTLRGELDRETSEELAVQ